MNVDVFDVVVIRVVFFRIRVAQFVNVAERTQMSFYFAVAAF